ncbi:MAG: hypothetical protein ACYCYO_07870 [Bacilli bacterium]
MFELTRQRKIIWVSVLSALLLASIVFSAVLIDQTIHNVASAVRQFRSGGGNFFDGNFSAGSPWFQGSVLATQTHTAAFSLPKGSAFSFAAPIGAIHVVPATGNRVLVTVQVTMAGETLAQAKRRAARTSLTQQTTGSSSSVTVNALDGKALHGIAATVEVPPGMAVTVIDHLGNIDVSGRFSSLVIRADMGNCNANAHVAGTTDIVDNLGNIVCRGVLGRRTTISNHMGNIAVYLSSRQALVTTVTTNLGTVNMVGALAGAFRRAGSAWTGTTGSGAPTGTLDVQNNLGNVTLSEVNAS